MLTKLSMMNKLNNLKMISLSLQKNMLNMKLILMNKEDININNEK